MCAPSRFVGVDAHCTVRVVDFESFPTSSSLFEVLASPGVIQKLFTTRSGRISGGTQDTLRMLGDSVDLDDGSVMLSTYITDDTVDRLMTLAQDAASKPGSRPMKSQKVRCWVQLQPML